MSIPTAEEITTNWGERCPDHDADCPCCQMWAMHDRIVELEKALQPFAAKADIIARDHPGWNHDVFQWGAEPLVFTMKDLRDARAAIGKGGE